MIFILLLIVFSLYGADHKSSSSASFQPIAHFKPAYHPKASLFHGSIEASNDSVTNHVYDFSIYKGLYPEIDALYNNGKKQELESMRSDLNSISSIVFNRNSLENRRKVQYIDSLLQGDKLTHLEQLARMAAINTPRRMRNELDAVYNKTCDPIRRCQALILADKKTGGHFIQKRGTLDSFDSQAGIYVSRDFYSDLFTQNPQVDLMVTTELGSYAIENILPESGARLTSEMTQAFVNELRGIVDSAPLEQRRTLISIGCEAFIRRLVDVKGTTNSHKNAVIAVSEELNKAIMHCCLENFNYVPQRTHECIADIKHRVASCSREDMARAVGERLADGLYIGMYAGSTMVAVNALEAACGMRSAGYITLEAINSCRRSGNLTDITAKVLNYERFITVEEALKFFNRLKLKDVVDKATGSSERICKVGYLPNGTTAVFRNFCTSLKEAGTTVATIEFQISECDVIKIRCAPKEVLDAVRR